MLGKLKEKLKSALSVFSKKAEEEAEVKEILVEKEVPAEVKPVERKKVEAVEARPQKKNIVEMAGKKVPPQKVEPEREPAFPTAPARPEAKKEIAQAPLPKPEIITEKIPSSELRITYFVHGTTLDNEQHIATGWAHGELSAQGKQQCVELREKIKSKHFDAVFCSDLRRAVDSARITFGNNILPDERLRECNYGDLNQKPDQVHHQFEKGNDIINGGYPHGESLKQVEKRLRSFLNSIYPQYKGRRIAIVAHRAPQLALEVILEGKTWPQAITEDWRLMVPKGWKPGWEFRMQDLVTEIPTAEDLITKTISEFSPERQKERQKRSHESHPQKEAAVSPIQQLLEEVGKTAEESKEPVWEKPAEKKGFFSRIKDTFAKKKEEVTEDTEEKEEVAVVGKKETPPAPGEELTSAESAEATGAEDKKGFFQKLKQSITTKTISAEKFEELFWDLELALLENNVSVEVIEKIKEDLKKELVEKPLPRDVEGKIMQTLKDTLLEILAIKNIDILENASHKKPYVIAFFGINGAGKTTSIAKLTHYFQNQGLSVVLAAGDTFRAAAIQQLQEHAEKLGVKCIQHDYGADAAAVAYDAVKYAEKNKIDVVMIDTAGRLHSNTNLMAELEKIIRVSKPDLKLFVGESITGNDCIEQAREFDQAVQLDGVVLTKADVDEKGGAPLSIAYTIKKPILFLGMGQRYEDLERFDAEKIVVRLVL